MTAAVGSWPLLEARGLARAMPGTGEFQITSEGNGLINGGVLLPEDVWWSNPC